MKQIDANFLEKAINEAIEEATPLGGGNSPKPLGQGGPKPLGQGGPKPLGGGKGPKPLGGGSAQAANSQQQGGKRADGTFAPSVEYAYYEKWWEDENPNKSDATDEDEVLKVGIGHIFDQHINYLLDKWNRDYSNILTAQGIRNKAKEDTGRHIQLRIKPGEEKNFMAIIPELSKDIASLSETSGKILKKTGALQQTPKVCKYDLPFFPRFEQILKDYISKAPSKADTGRMEANIAKTWKELLQNMKDPATLQKIQGIGGMIYSTTSTSLTNGDVRGKGGIDAGHQLSMQNRIEVFSQDPNATFVTQEFVWRDYFNREIVDPSQTIIITKPTSRKPKDSNAFEQACIRCGFSGAAEFADRQKKGEISTQQLWAVRAAYNKLNPADTYFSKIIVYDVANTRVMLDSNGNPMEDKFNTEMGLVDNLKGIPNQNTLAADQTLAQQTGQNFIQGQMTGKTDDEMAEIGKIIEAMTMVKAGTVAGKSGNLGDDIVSNCYLYAKMLANGINFSKDEYTEAFCQSFACAVAATYGIESPKGADYLRRVLANRGVDKELATMINLFFTDYKAFIVEINRQLQMAAKRMKKSGAKVSQAIPNVQSQQTVNEEENMDTSITPVQPLTADELSKVLGIPAELMTGEYEVQEDTPGQKEIRESFYSFMDRMDGIF